MEGEVVEGDQDRRPVDDRIGRVTDVALDRRGAGVPIVQVEDVERAPVGTQRFQRRPAEEPEAPRVVGVIAGIVAVEAVAIERGRMVDQAQPIAVGRHVEDGDRADARRRARVRDAQRERALDVRRLGHPAVARQEDIDRRLDLGAAQFAERSRQGVDDIGQAARLGPRLAFGGEHRDAHRQLRHPRHRTRRSLRRRPDGARRGVN